VPVPDELRGEEVKAYVVPVQGADLDVAVLVAHTRERLAYFKVPRYWELRESLPMTPSEKVAKATLRAEQPEQLGPCYDAVAQRWLGPVRPLPPAGGAAR
jgi:crotonobetaine/carnitine-CoA ligase